MASPSSAGSGSPSSAGSGQAVHGVVVAGGIDRDGRYRIRRLAERDDLVGVTLVRDAGRAGPWTDGDRADPLHLARQRGLPDAVLDPAGPSWSPLAPRLAGLALAANPFLVVVEPGGVDPSATVAALSSTWGRHIVVVDPSSPLIVPVAPPPSALSPAEADLLAAALGPPDVAAEAWQRCRPPGGIDDIPRFAAVAPLVVANLGRAGFDDPDRARMQGTARRSWYAARVLLAAAGRAVEALRRGGVEGLLVGQPAVRLLVPDAVGGWERRIELVVDPAGPAVAAAALEAAGWVPVAGPGGQAPAGRGARSFRERNGLRLRVSTGILPDRGDRRVDLAGERLPAELDGRPIQVLGPAATLARHWAHSARRAERVGAVIGTETLLRACGPGDVPAARAWADTLGVSGTAQLHLDALAALAARS